MELQINENGERFFEKIRVGQKKAFYAYFPFLAFLTLMGLARLDLKFNFFVLTIPALFLTYYMIYIPAIGASIIKRSVFEIIINKDNSFDIVSGRTFFSTARQYHFDRESLKLTKADSLNKYFKVDPTYLFVDRITGSTLYFYPTFFIKNQEIKELLDSITPKI